MPRAKPLFTMPKKRRLPSRTRSWEFTGCGGSSSSDEFPSGSTVSTRVSSKSHDESRRLHGRKSRNLLVRVRRRVQFDEKCNETHLLNTQMEAVDSSSLWYTAEEIEAFKKSHSFSCCMIQRVDASKPQEEQYAALLARLYAACCDDTTTKETAALLVEELESYFASQGARGIARIGLTAALVPAVALDNALRRQRLLELHGKLFLLPHWSHNSAVRELALACESVTSGPQIFALVIARAQLKAL